MRNSPRFRGSMLYNTFSGRVFLPYPLSQPASSRVGPLKEGWRNKGYSVDDNENDNESLFSYLCQYPWQVLHSPPRICQEGVAGFSLAPVQRAYNERVRAYTITFLPPGRFFIFSSSSANQ